MKKLIKKFKVLDIDNLSGVYILKNKGKIVYVGKCSNIYMRIRQHREDKVFDKVLFYHVADNSVASILERELIKYLNPIENDNLFSKLNINKPFGKKFKPPILGSTKMLGLIKTPSVIYTDSITEQFKDTILVDRNS